MSIEMTVCVDLLPKSVRRIRGNGLRYRMLEIPVTFTERASASISLHKNSLILLWQRVSLHVLCHQLDIISTMRPPQWYLSYQLWLNRTYKYISIYPTLRYTCYSLESSTKPGSTAQNISTDQFPRLDCSSPWVIDRRQNLLPSRKARTKNRPIKPSVRDVPRPHPAGRSYGNFDKIEQDQLEVGLRHFNCCSMKCMTSLIHEVQNPFSLEYCVNTLDY